MERFELELGGKVVPVEYRYGTLDYDKRDHLVLGGKAKYYYQGNQTSQGIDIRLGKRGSGNRTAAADLEDGQRAHGQPPQPLQ